MFTSVSNLFNITLLYRDKQRNTTLINIPVLFGVHDIIYAYMMCSPSNEPDTRINNKRERYLLENALFAEHLCDFKYFAFSALLLFVYDVIHIFFYIVVVCEF